MPVSPALAVEGAARVLTAPAVAIVEDLTRCFRPRIDELLSRRRATQEHFSVGGRPDFLAETSDVTHPGLVGIAKQVFVFDEGMPDPNQLDRLRDDAIANAQTMLEAPRGPRTEAGLRHNIRVGSQYPEAWLGGQGGVPIYNLMEDAAPPKSRARRSGSGSAIALRSTMAVTHPLVEQLIGEEFVRVRDEVG